MPSLLNVRNLSIFHPHSHKLVDDVSFEVNAGETLAIVGESGSGKSLTALSILGLTPLKTVGSASFKGEELIGSPHIHKFRSQHVGFIFQEPLSALNPLHTIERQVEEPLVCHTNMTKLERKARLQELFDMVELPTDRLQNYPHQLSGGQRQRVMIAMALACKPSMLIADEPTTALDAVLQRNIMEKLSAIQSSMGMGLLLISHDLHMVTSKAQNISVMYQGAIVEMGPAHQVIQNPKHPYTKKLLDGKPKGSAVSGVSMTKPIVKAEMLSVQFERPKPFLQFKKEEPFQALHPITLAIHKKETLGVLGESGSGKTTLAKALLRFVHANGDVFFHHYHWSKLPHKKLQVLRPHFQMLFQDPFSSLNPKLSIAQIVYEGLMWQKKEYTKKLLREAAKKALRDVGLDASFLDRYPHECSGGQRQRIALARALIMEPECLILDEPTSALDASIQSEMVNLLRNIQAEKGISYILISHDIRVVKALSHRIIVLRDGRIVEEGDTKDLCSNPEHPYTRELMRDVI